MRNPTSARITRIGALAVGAATLALAGCAGSSSTSTSSANPASTATTSTTGTSPTTPPAVGQFNAQAAPLLDTFFAAARQYAASCCSGTNYDAEASAVRAYQAANMTFTDGLAKLTSPPSLAVPLQNYIASVHADVANSGQILRAVLARDPAAIRAAIRVWKSSPAASAAAKLDAVLLALGVHNSDVVGYWDGNVTQHGPGTTRQSYFVEMTVTGSTPGVIAGTISYPNLPCGGRLRLLSAQGILHIYREEITSGRTQCSAGGTIYTTVLGGAMAWRWVAADIVVTGELDHLQRPGN